MFFKGSLGIWGFRVWGLGCRIHLSEASLEVFSGSLGALGSLRVLGGLRVL